MNEPKKRVCFICGAPLNWALEAALAHLPDDDEELKAYCPACTKIREQAVLDAFERGELKPPRDNGSSPF